MNTLGYRTLDAKHDQIPQRDRWRGEGTTEVTVTLTVRQVAILRQALARFPARSADELHELADIDREIFASTVEMPA